MNLDALDELVPRLGLMAHRAFFRTRRTVIPPPSQETAQEPEKAARPRRRRTNLLETMSPEEMDDFLKR